MRLLSSETKDWKSRVVSETEQVLVKKSAEAPSKANETQKKHSSGICTSPTVLMYSSLQKVCTEKHQQLHSANERRLQLEAQTLRMSQDMEQQTFSIADERKVRQLQDKSAAQPDLQTEQWTPQLQVMMVSQVYSEKFKTCSKDHHQHGIPLTSLQMMMTSSTRLKTPMNRSQRYLFKQPLQRLLRAPWMVRDALPDI